VIKAKAVSTVVPAGRFKEQSMKIRWF